jgi:DNA invertase Pin-like site-specific DNA recombinase
MYTKKLITQPQATPANAEAQRPKNFNRSRTKHYSMRLGRPVAIYDRQKVRDLSASGLSVRANAKQVGIPKSLVFNLLVSP